MAFFKSFPSLILPRATDLTVERLRELDCDVVLFDVDQTLVPPKSDELMPGVAEHFTQLFVAGIPVGLFSNTILPGKKERRVHKIAHELGVPAMCLNFFLQKPIPFGIWLALRKLGIRRRSQYRNVMVAGDQLFTDCLAGWLAGAHTCFFTDRLGSEAAYTSWKRAPERWFLEHQGRLPESMR